MLVSDRAGELVTEDFEYDGGRRATAYVPRGEVDAIVFAGDGQLIAPWGQTLHEAGMHSTMVVGSHRPEDETLRLHEYSPQPLLRSNPCGSLPMSSSSFDSRPHARPKAPVSRRSVCDDRSRSLGPPREWRSGVRRAHARRLSAHFV